MQRELPLRRDLPHSVSSLTSKEFHSYRNRCDTFGWDDIEIRVKPSVPLLVLLLFRQQMGEPFLLVQMELVICGICTEKNC